MPPLPPLPNRDFRIAKWVDEYVARILDGYRWRVPNEPKLIRDAVHGYQLLAPHEVAVLDSPLVQRLRTIHQTALAYYVYPTASHTRLDHSLGVMRMVERIVEGLAAADPSEDIGSSVKHRVRLAALLHDTGHVLFSHLGERAASAAFEEEIRAAKQAAPEHFEGKSLGEILSYLMITSPAFAAPMDRMLQTAGLHDVLSSRVAPLVLGRASDPSQQFEADMISGPFDADKLDYLLRDCHFSGIRASVDVERVYYTVRLLHVPGEPRSLAMHISGVPNLEQILFAKMILYSSVYHHQKVRALECMFLGILERLQEYRDSLRHPELKLTTLSDWLSLSEQQLIVLGMAEERLRGSIECLLNRNLLKRALVISIDTVADGSQDGLIGIYNDTDLAAQMRGLRQEIYDEMGKTARGEIFDLWIDVPEPPTVIRDVLQVKVTSDQQSHRPLSTERFQWERWTNNYGEIKWRSHVFCADRDKTRRSAARAAARVLKSRYNIRLNRSARSFAKLPAQE